MQVLNGKTPKSAKKQTNLKQMIYVPKKSKVVSPMNDQNLQSINFVRGDSPNEQSSSVNQF